MAVRKKYIELLKPYLVGEEPKTNGEWDMHCPLHEDDKRSANLNVDSGVWFCHKGCGGGTVRQLINSIDEWLDPPSTGVISSNGHGLRKRRAQETITEARIAGWMQALQADDKRLRYLTKDRKLSNDTILDYEIGWDRNRGVYSIPVRGPKREIWNIRRYDPTPKDERRKIFSVKGMGSPARLWPLSILKQNPDYIIVCEGEWDALITIQAGFPAITKTSSAKTWMGSWNQEFADKVVYVCNDMDEAGQDANRKIARALKGVAKSVHIVNLPYEIVERHGNDLSDYFKENKARDFRALLKEARGADGEEAEELDPTDASVLDSFDSGKVGHPLRLTVTIKGKKDPGYSIPQNVRLTCTRDYGDKCNFCPMNSAGGEDTLEVDGHDPSVLSMMESSKKDVLDQLRRAYGVPVKCPKLEIDIEKHQAVEVLFARPSVEHVNGSGVDVADYKSIKITSVGRHDTNPNNTVRVTGALFPDPRRQLNEFQAWDIEPLGTGIDTFKMNKEIRERLKRFRPSEGQRPIKKLAEIARETARHVTHIYGRPEMHALMDLVWHSALAFNFGGQLEKRGWLEALIIGDTRTGKSEAATRLSQHYGSGEIVSCESASFAGVIGGLQQYGAGKEWSINWGVVPLNDRRLVVLDEVGGLAPEEIAQLSDVRSSGVAQLTKIQQERTLARTRLLWLGNPRNARMADFTYGVQAIRPLVGNSEDIARFDLAMSVKAGEVPAEDINRAHRGGRNRYDTESCQLLIKWIWSRKPDQILWRPSAEEAVYKAAQDMGQRYVEDPPLVQAANVRVKIARVAVALAGRTFSSDRKANRIIVKKQHVEDAVTFIDIIYGMQSFGYSERSTELIDDRKQAIANKKSTKQYIRGQQGLSKFLRSQGHFRRQDLEEILDISREEANSIISILWEARMVRKDKGNVVIEPTLHELLREVK